MKNFVIGEQVYVVTTEDREHTVERAEVKEFQHSVNMSWIVVEKEDGEMMSTRNRIFKTEKDAITYAKSI